MLRIMRHLSHNADQKLSSLEASKSPFHHQFLKPLDISQNSHYLKRMEMAYSPKSPRTKYEYKENYAASIALPIEDKILDKNKNNIAALSSLSKALTLEHAARRVDLFFYTLIAYHNSKMVPESGWTKLQHGRGRSGYDKSSITQACHSSLTPDLIDNTITKKIPLKSDFDDNLTIKTSIISGTHFMDSLNSTIELPKFVNELDTEIENVYSCRQKSLEIIADVANGLINPIEGLNVFLSMMQDTFRQMWLDRRFYKPIFSSPPYLKEDESIILKGQILSLVKKGTFINKWGETTASLNDKYISMLLRLTPAENEACQSSNKLKEHIYQKKMFEIQNEIIKTPSSHVHVQAENLPRRMGR